MITRRKVREKVLQAVYAFELGGGGAKHTIETIIVPGLQHDAAALAFAKRLFLQSLAISEDADLLIAEHAEHWDLARIALLDRLVLRMALCEFLCFEDIPPKVTINEAIEIGKQYSTGGSGKFINGILDAALAQLQERGELRKSGRGLIGMTTE